MLNLKALTIGQKLVIERDGVEHVMEVYSISEPGTWGTARYHGPHVGAWIRPGGHAVTFDYSHLNSGMVKARLLTEEDCEEFIANGSCIHSDHTK